MVIKRFLKMKKIICGALIFGSAFSFAQNILNAKSPEEFRKLREQNEEKIGDSIVSTKATPLKYGYINDKDILKSIVVWEIIDLNDKLNQPIYHNSDGLVSQSKSLYQVLIDGIKGDSITEVYDDDNFVQKLTPEETSQRLSRVATSDWLIDKINSGQKITEEDKKAGTDVYETKSKDIKMLKIKGMWYIDARDGEMKYRLLGIAPMGPDPQTLGQNFGGKEDLVDLFWIFYPDARNVTANTVVFNGKNLSSNITFDDILNARRFSTVIYKADNGMGNGVIKDYIPNDAEGQLEESDKIKDQILQMENDLWNY